MVDLVTYKRMIFVSNARHTNRHQVSICVTRTLSKYAHLRKQSIDFAYILWWSKCMRSKHISRKKNATRIKKTALCLVLYVCIFYINRSYHTWRVSSHWRKINTKSSFSNHVSVYQIGMITLRYTIALYTLYNEANATSIVTLDETRSFKFNNTLDFKNLSCWGHMNGLIYLWRYPKH